MLKIIIGAEKAKEMDLDNKDNKYGLEVKTSNSNKPKSLNVFLEKGSIDEA